ncbi:MAG TPA: HlyD family efflux transporter periplasmic adaptor subunit [Gemmatimonas sp.]|nr:HlyD family efflux transporter periplasmic adaptor subunit [Gemmatimonas sp.]
MLATGEAARLAPVLLASLVLLTACREPEPATAAGTLEMLEVDVGPLQAARVVLVTAKEGDLVRAGDTLVMLTIPTIAAATAQADAHAVAARASARDLDRGAQPAELARAEAELRAATVDADRLAVDLARLERVAAGGDVSRAALDAARAASRTSAERREALSESLRLLQGGARTERRRAARAEADAAGAAADAVRATAGDLVLLAPMDGIVTSRNAEPGEVLGAGASALTIGVPARPWARVYVSQFVLQGLSVGDTLVARLDGDSTAYRGRIVSIASKAEFTPRVALTDDERADLLFGVKLEFDDRSRRLKAGLPITVQLPATAGPKPP